MKMNGIIRRVDNLGRVVIPREFRKLHKISLGDPMEISCRDSGEIILKKVDMSLTLEELSAEAVKLLAAQLGGTVLVSNAEAFICGSGADKTCFVGAALPEDITRSFFARKSMAVSEIPDKWNFDCGKKSLICEPIIGQSDVFGGLFLVRSGEADAKDAAMLKITAAILGNGLQKY